MGIEETMVMIYGTANVYDEALKRIQLVYDEFENVVVFMSGGKDSAVLFEMASIVCEGLGRKVDVLWLDQEAEWQGTVDYMKSVFKRPNVVPYWCQFPFDFDSSMKLGQSHFRIFEEGLEDLHVHPQEEGSITVNPTGSRYFHDILQDLPKALYGTNEVAVLSGMRASESPVRRIRTMFSRSPYKTFGWSSTGPHRTLFYPLYDWKDADIWTALAKNEWAYNSVYDKMHHVGYPRRDMRISALIHETAWQNLYALQEIEPKTYDRFISRIPGVLTYCHINEETMRIRKLPDAFVSWKDYRDYLLEVFITDEVLKEHYRSSWNGQDDEESCKIQTKGLMVGDFSSTKTINKKVADDFSEITRRRLEP